MVSDEAFRMGMRKSFHRATGGRHSATDVLRVALWYETLEQRLGCDTACGLEAVIEPQVVMGEAVGFERHPRNKWRRYRFGENTPRADVIDRAEAAVPGSAALLCHVFWDCVNPNRSLRWLSSALRSRVAPEAYIVLRDETKTDSTGKQYVSGWASRKFERRPGFDTMACLAYLFRCAMHQGDESSARCVGSTLRRLLIIESAVRCGRVTPYVYEFIDSVWFSLHESDCLIPLAGFDYERALSYLRHCIETLRFGSEGEELAVALARMLASSRGLPLESRIALGKALPPDRD